MEDNNFQSSSIDQEKLLKYQYQDGQNLTARGLLHARYSINPYPWFRWLFDHFVIPETASILELGCGPGWLWTENEDRRKKSWNITLSDFSAGMLEDAQTRLANAEPPYIFQVIDAQTIPYPDHHFDTVIANHMLYHVPNLTKAISEIRRVLKPGGHFYASTIGAHHLEEIATFMPQNLFPFGSRFSFNLQNGHESLAASFANVEVYRYEDALKVTNATHLLDYIFSLSERFRASKQLGETLITNVTKAIEEQGLIYLTKETGFFTAW